ncbi:hypothetical protein PG993_001051 [Apiospora rasikravindrae]|uniref:MARVEL domain-containing protein n=1 Tax=Apiospora rasikravindrae TaxID=990691 RepID=A0ABR1UAB4_9PEZI
MDVRARKHGYEIIPTPVWVLVVRIFQIVLSVIAIGIAGWWIHGLYLNELGFVIACCVFTWIVSLYAILSEKAAGCRSGYNTWATLSLDGLLIVFWLAAMGATASARASFKYSVTASCTSDGSALNSGHCEVLRRRYTDTVGVASYGALDVLSGLAGICALIMLLFVASFAYVCHFFRLSYTEANAVPDPEKENNAAAAAPIASAPTGATAAPGYPMHAGTEMHPVAQQSAPYGSPQQQPQQPQYQYQAQHQQQQQQPPLQQNPMMHQTSNAGYTQQAGYAQPVQGAQNMGYSPSQTPAPYTQNNVHMPGTGMHSPGQVGQQQYPYSPGMSPQGPVQ